jgi:hypothetical protein
MCYRAIQLGLALMFLSHLPLMGRIMNAANSDQPYLRSLQTILYKELRKCGEVTDPNSLRHYKERTGNSLKMGDFVLNESNSITLFNITFLFQALKYV